MLRCHIFHPLLLIHVRKFCPYPGCWMCSILIHSIHSIHNRKDTYHLSSLSGLLLSTVIEGEKIWSSCEHLLDFFSLFALTVAYLKFLSIIFIDIIRLGVNMDVTMSGDQRSGDCVPAKYRIQDNPLDNLDFASDEFKAGVSELAAMLKIPEHPDHLITLGAINHLVQTRLNSDALKKDNSADGKQKLPANMDDKALTLDSSPLGFQVSDKQLERPAKVLRMLYLNDMRDLQNNINRSIVKIQEITAHPKTDSNLGQVGR